MKGLPAPKVSPQTIVNNQIVAAVINQELHPAIHNPRGCLWNARP